MGQKTDNKVMKQMQNLWNQKPNNRQHLSDDEINDMLSSDERVDKLYHMMKGKINEIGDTENGMYAIGQVAGRAYDRMLNGVKKDVGGGAVALDPKYGKVAQDAAYAAAGGYMQWAKKFEKANGRKPTDKERQIYMQNYHNGSNDYGRTESERKGVVKLSESQLRGMIVECVKKVLKEYTYGVEGELVPDYGDFYHGEPYIAGDNPFADKDNKYTDKGRDKELSIEALESLWSKITELQQVAYKVRTDEGGKYLLRVFPQECQRLKELFPSFCIGEPIFAMQQAIDVLNGLRDKLKNEKYQ